MRGYRLNDYESCCAFDIPILSPKQIDDILGIIYTCRYFARSHHKKRINKKWHKRYGVEYFGSKEERYFENHNKQIIRNQKTTEADNEIINNKKYHTCGRCKYENIPDDKHPCISCIYGTGYGADLWELKEVRTKRIAEGFRGGKVPPIKPDNLHWESEQDKNEAMASSLGNILDRLAMDMSCE